MKTFKIMGLLLSYPKQELMTHLDDLMHILELEKILPNKHRKRLKAFAEELKAEDIYKVQENYVDLFDRGRAHCLQLFEHIHGESRDRGQAMVNLAEAYAEKDLYVTAGEMPDYLPLFLEFLSLCPVEEAFELLGDPITVIATIGVRLKKRNSSYAVIFEALGALSKVKPNQEMIAAANAEPLEEMTLDDIDKEWEEASAFDNSDVASDDCNSCNAFPHATKEFQEFADHDLSGNNLSGNNMNGGQ